MLLQAQWTCATPTFAGAMRSQTKRNLWTAVRKKDVRIIEFFSSAFILDPVVPLEIEDSQGNVFTQTMTYSGEAFDEKSINIKVPPHQGGETAFDQLTVVMHAATFGYWHYYSLKVN